MITQATQSRIRPLREFKTETLFGAAITRLLSDDELPSVGFDHVRISQGSSLSPHQHEFSASFIYILEGTAIVTLADQTYRVSPGDTLYIPPGVNHGFRTPDSDVVLLSVQSPPIYPDERAADIQFQ